jgi:4-hydroxy-4-methyl-2-oxoglutarate aldolase
MNSKLIDLLREFDAATLYEAAGQKGMIDPAIRPAWPGAALCGPAATVRCPPGDNLALHQAVAATQPGVVLVASVGGLHGRSLGRGSDGRRAGPRDRRPGN